MVPVMHYDPIHTQCLITDNASELLLLVVATAIGWPIEHMYISNAYVHEPSAYRNTLYVRLLPRSDGTFFHVKSVVQLLSSTQRR